VEEYFTKMTDLVAANHRFKSRPALDLDDPARSIDHVTNFERKYRIEGRMIFRAHYVLQ
jgi:tRNA (guanine-N7-)-methyltransferase